MNIRAQLSQPQLLMYIQRQRDSELRDWGLEMPWRGKNNTRKTPLSTSDLIL